MTKLTIDTLNDQMKLLDCEYDVINYNLYFGEIKSLKELLSTEAGEDTFNLELSRLRRIEEKLLTLIVECRGMRTVSLETYRLLIDLFNSISSILGYLNGVKRTVSYTGIPPKYFA